MKKETTQFEHNNVNYEQKVIDSLYRMLNIINADSTQLQEFKLVIKKKPSVNIKTTGELNLNKELNQVIQYLNDFEQSNVSLDINVNNIFLGVEKIIKFINPLDFEKETFNDFYKVINKLITCFSKNYSSEQRMEWKKITLKYGELVALIHDVAITKINLFSRSLSQRLDNAEKENLLINNKLLDLEKTSNSQLKIIEQLQSRIKTLSS